MNLMNTNVWLMKSCRLLNPVYDTVDMVLWRMVCGTICCFKFVYLVFCYLSFNGQTGFFLRCFQIALLKEDKVLVVCITVSTKYWSACRDLAKERP